LASLRALAGNLLLGALGWKATVVFGDPCVRDRSEWLRRHLRDGALRTLDAGCGTGAFTMFAATIGNDAVGLSFDRRNNEVAADRAKRLGLCRIQFLTADLRELDRQTDLGMFDQIICFETIEHILDDRKLLREFAWRLNPGGRLLLTTLFSGYIPLPGDEVGAKEDGGHVRWGYTQPEMAALLAEFGLVVERQDYLSGVVSQKLTALLRRLSTMQPLAAWAMTFPLRALQIFDRPLTRLTGYPYMTIAVVAVKVTCSKSCHGG
jgi:2-polyprenyl-3-methyl-5-hydroxy-6-metoxy-1,4-benzoquinol methylase